MEKDERGIDMQDDTLTQELEVSTPGPEQQCPFCQSRKMHYRGETTIEVSPPKGRAHCREYGVFECERCHLTVIVARGNHLTG